MIRALPLALFALLSLSLPAGCGDDDDAVGGAGSGGSSGSGGSTSNSNCCTADTQCGDDQCVGGSCTEVPAGRCFQDTDCVSGETCQGATVCPCGEMCVAGTMPGTCKAASCPATVADSIDPCPKDGVSCDYAGDDGCPVRLVCTTYLSISRWVSVAPSTGDACTTEGKVCSYRVSVGDSPSVIKTATCGNSLWSVTEKQECSLVCDASCVCPTGTTCQATAGQTSTTCQ